LKTYLEHPNANKDVVKGVFGLAKVKADPDEVLAEWQKLPPEQRANSTFATKPDGSMGFVARNVTPVEQQRIETAKTNAVTAEERERRLAEKYEEDRVLAGLPPRQLPAAGAVPVKSAAPERIISNPKTGEKMVLRDGQWQPLK